MSLSSPKSGFSPLLIAPFFLWGTAMVAMKGTIWHTTPYFLAGLRLLPAGLLVLIWAAFTGRKSPQTWTAWGWITLFALVDGTLFQGFLAQGLARTDAGLGSVMIDSQPLAVALLAAWLFGERIGWVGWIGLLVGVGGISLLGLPENLWLDLQAGTFVLSEWTGDPGQTFINLFDNGQWLMLLAALSMAVGTVLSRYVSRHVDSVVATGWHMVVGGIPMVWLTATQETQQWQQLQSGDWAALLYATVFGSAIAYGLFFNFAASGSLTSLSVLTFLTPVFALLFGNIFLAETLTTVQSIGVLLTLVSIYLINQRAVLGPSIADVSPLSASLEPLPDQAENLPVPSVIPPILADRPLKLGTKSE
jgi:drug/metabolite transporter (DMT)-like permease